LSRHSGGSLDGDEAAPDRITAIRVGSSTGFFERTNRRLSAMGIGASSASLAITGAAIAILHEE
jgi:hypothetical protein